MTHLSSDQLRDFSFNLLPEDITAETSAHLESCSACRNQLTSIKAQFDTLNILQDQPEVSEERLKAVLEKQNHQRVPLHHIGKVIPLRTAGVLATAAGLAIVFMLSRPDQPEVSRQKQVASKEAVHESLSDQLSGDELRSASVYGLADAAPPKTLAAMRAEQPFAPASNIELNVLPSRDDVQLTIYNAADLTLVRENRKLTLKRGWNWMQFMWSNTLIDPTSLDLQPVTHGNEVEITQLVYPPRLKDLARWTIFSEISGEVEFELTYFTSGLNWGAHYEATLSANEKMMELRSRIRVNNHSGEDYENAQTRLVVGELNLTEPIATLAARAYPYSHSMPIKNDASGAFRYAGLEGMVWGSNAEFKLGDSDYDGRLDFEKEILKKALSEYQLYTIEGRETIPNGWGKRLPNFEVQQIGVTNLYKYDEERWNQQTVRYLSFANTEKCNLGETPLPEGQVRVFRNIEAASLGYISAAHIKYIPVNEKVELELGYSEKVKVEPKLMRTRTTNYAYDNKGNVCGFDQTTRWKIELTNTKDIPVKVEVTRAAHSNSWDIQTAAPYEKYDAGHFRFTDTIAPRSKQTIEYELTIYHGTRQSDHAKQ